MTPLGSHSFVEGSMFSLPSLDGRQANSFGQGSRNQILTGLASSRPWKGLQTKGANSGGRQMFQVGTTFGSLRDIGGLQGKGSLFQDIARSLFFIGAGQINISGTDLAGITASTLLQVSIAVAGVYSAGTTYQAGLPQPSTPDIALTSAPGAGFTGRTNGPVSMKIARLRTTTGGRSIASLTSVVVIAAGNSIRVTFPAASASQTHWRVFATQEGFGGVGLHYALPYVPGGVSSAGYLDIPESVVAAGTVDGIGRSLEFDYTTGDLVPELAYIDDYPPPAGTHAVRIENVMVVLGVLADSSSSVSSTNTGTVGACSLPNFYESYKPTDRVYFPGPIVDVRSRPTDSYGYVAGTDWIMALQYVGLRDGPAVAVTSIVPDVGIAKPQNWCQVGGLLYARIANGSFIRMRDDGSVDYQWAAPIAEAVAGWDSGTVVEWHPDSMSVVASNGGESWAYSLLTNKWGVACYVTDAGVTGTILSATHSQGELVVTVNNAGAHTAYAWDKGAAKMAISSVTPYKDVSSIFQAARALDVRELNVAFRTDRTADPLILAIFANSRQHFVRDAVTTNASNQITSATLDLTNRIGQWICVWGAGVGGAGVDYLIGRISGTVAGGVTIVNAAGATLNAQASLAGCYMQIARQFVTWTPVRTDKNRTDSLTQPMVLNVQDYAIGASLITNATQGTIDLIKVGGSPRGTPYSSTS